MQKFIEDVRAEKLREKARQYIIRAFHCEENDDNEGFLIWSSLSLEIMLKSSLASINPILIIDTKDESSALASIGKESSKKIRTITAEKCCSIISKINPYFSSLVKTFCLEIIENRNTELHSAGKPYSTKTESDWQPDFWHVMHILLEMSKIEIEDWLTGTEATTWKMKSQKIEEATEKAIEAKIRKHKEKFEKMTKSEKTDLQNMTKENLNKLIIETIKKMTGENIEDVITEKCPACKSEGCVGIEPLPDETNVLYGSYDEHNEYYEEVEETEIAVCFFCPSCNLQLKNTNDMQLAQIEIVRHIRSMRYETDPSIQDGLDLQILDQMED
jgi:hypothetical protein